MKTTRIFHLKVFIFLVVKFSIYLNRRVFVMFLTSHQHNYLSICQIFLNLTYKIGLKLDGQLDRGLKQRIMF